MHYYPVPLQNMIDAADRAESYLMRHCNPPSDAWERESWESLRADRRRIAVVKACWTRWNAYCARAAGSAEFADEDKLAREIIDDAVASGFPQCKVDEIGNEVKNWTL